MDPVSKKFCGQCFELAFIKKKGSEFQKWFVELSKLVYGTDFETVRSYGNQGDWKCDGRRVSTGTIFQCYGPEIVTDARIVDKINTDFYGVWEKWPDFMKRWVFVYNHPDGQPPKVVDHLDKIRKGNPGVAIEI